MSSEFDVSDDVKNLINDIILKNNWAPISEIKYYPGSEAGEGYASKHVAVDIISKNKKLRLFVKYTFDIQNIQDESVEKFYSNETYFYDAIYPAYTNFLKKKSVENDFRYIPKCYGTSKKNVIVLENLREKGFVLFNRKDIMNDKHISLVLRTLAKFHAASYAFKDQKREIYDKVTAHVNQDFMGAQSQGKDSVMLKMIWDIVDDALNKLDPEADKFILDKCNANDIFKIVVDVDSYVNEYSILTQGDCWCNNMMFLYEKEDKDNPKAVVLIDWQLQRLASPVFDISYFFYSIANEETLSKLDFYLGEYYTELSNQIRSLGSDPDRLYPFLVFEKEWKSHSKYGFAIAFTLIKYMLIEKDEVPQVDQMDFEKLTAGEKIDYFTKYDNEDEYLRRIRVLCKFMIDNNYL